MEKEKKDQNKKEKEECPLCKVSEEAIKILKEREDKVRKKKNQKMPKISRKFAILFLIFVFVGFSFIFYQFSQKSSPKIVEEGSKPNVFNILPKGLEIGELAPDFVSEDVYGDKISLSDFKNKKPVLLVFWATWCSICRKELPDLKAFTKDHQNEIKVIAVSSGEPKETIKDYIRKESVNFLIVLDEDRKIWNQYFVRGTPSHFLIDKEGKIVSMRPGLVSLKGLETMLTMIR